MSFNTFCGQDPTNAATYNKVLLRFQEGGGGGGIAAVNQGTNIDIPIPAVPVVSLANPLNAPLNLGIVDVLDTAGAMGAAGTVLSSLGAGTGTSWVANGVATVIAGTNIDIPNPAVPVVALANPLTATLNMGAEAITDSAGAVGVAGEVLGCGVGGQTLWGSTLPFIPINRLINAPPTIRPIDSGAAGGPAELTAGGLAFNVSDLYDPLVPYGTSVRLMCEIFYQATYDKPIFIPGRPLSSGATGVYVFNEDNTSGAPFSFAPTQLTFVFDYLVNGLAASFTEKATIGQSTLTRLCPQVAGIIPLATPIAEGYNANVHLIGSIDCSTLNPADVITFRLLGFTSFAGLTIDTTGATAPVVGANYFGQIGIKCYMARV